MSAGAPSGPGGLRGPDTPALTSSAPLLQDGEALEVRVSDCIPLSQRWTRRLVSVEPKPEQPEPEFRCSRGAFTLLWPSC